MNKTIYILIIFVLSAAVVFLGLQYYLAQQQLQKFSDKSRINAKIIAFDKLFVEKVLKMQGEVSYEDRLKLETAVAAVNDIELLADWRNFLTSKTETEAQQNVLIILSAFADKIVY
ncbi:MAG: hypothetical protein NT026_02120 [Candidatus Staskawiczbacteria bacterium]|nr:hypothetical protein [Candidatus Staskawiczbacteria bacterium]